ncbi:unnamed protein product [Paramecium primaurelia]|uniref:Uncharacterized protein n=1 Tax=Paramecium primaurelia TaxID=5886 RepID=A0A8S1NDB7_PARPR|nr:unnamed protein product [Paramecium primaurelia]
MQGLIAQNGSDEETEFIFDPHTIQLKETRSKISKANEEIKQLNEQNKELIMQLNRQNELLELKHKQNQQLQAEANKFKEQIDDREHKLLQSMKEKQQLQNELIAMHEILDQTTQRNDQINSEVFALKLTLEQIQQTVTMCKEETTQGLQRELKLKGTIDQLNKNLKQQEEQLRKITNDANKKDIQFKFEMQNKESIIQELRNQLQQQQQQNNEIINELIEQKNQNIQNSVYGKDYKPELSKITKDNEELKNKFKGLTYQLNIQKEKEQSYIKEITTLRQMQSNLSTEIERLLNKINEQKLELLNQQQESQNVIQEKDKNIYQLMNQLSLLKNQDQKINLHKSISHNGDEKLLRDIQLKNDQIAMLQNENNQLVKLIESLKNQQIDNQGTEKIKIKQLESELKNLQSFIYDSPLVVLFNLLEDRLSKQQQKSFENKNKIKEFWATQLKQWTEGFEELKQAFSGLKIVFKYDLKYANQTSQQ